MQSDSFLQPSFKWIMFLDRWGSCVNVFTVYWAFCPKQSNKIKFLVWLFVPFGLTIKTTVASQKTLKQFIQRQAAVRNALHYNKCMARNMQHYKLYIIIIKGSLPPVKMDCLNNNWKLHCGVHMNWTFETDLFNFSIQLSNQALMSNWLRITTKRCESGLKLKSFWAWH